MRKSIKPILLTHYGETLRLTGADGVAITNHKTKIEGVIGFHDVCNGSMAVHKISSNFRAILCESCGLRVVIPKEYKTIGDLRNIFEVVIP